MAEEPDTLFFRVLKVIFKILLVLSSFFILLGVFTLWIGFIALRDEQNHHERADEDVAALKIIITALFISVSFGSLQTIVGWIGILKIRLRFFVVYFVIEVLCFLMWFVIYVFAESKSGPTYSLLSSFLRLLISQLIIQTIKRHQAPQSEEQKETSIEPAIVLPVDESHKNGRIIHNQTVNRFTEDDDDIREDEIPIPPPRPLPTLPIMNPPTDSHDSLLHQSSREDNVDESQEEDDVDSNFAADHHAEPIH